MKLSHHNSEEMGQVNMYFKGSNEIFNYSTVVMEKIINRDFEAVD